MSRLDNVTKITADNVSEDSQESVEYIGGIINGFMEEVKTILNGRVDYDNLRNDLIEIQVTVDSTGAPTTGGQFISNYNTLRAVKVLNATNLTNSTTYPTSTPYIIYEGNGQGTYTIKKILGLPASNSFRLLAELIP